MDRYVGIDLGIRTKHRAAVLDGPNLRGKPFSFEVSRAGFEKMLQRATEGAEGPIKVVMEPTGLAWVPAAAYISAAGHQVFLGKPKKVSDLRKFLRQHTKSDPVDAEASARLPQVDPKGVQPLRLPTAEQMTLRRLVKRRERLMGEVADQKRRIHALMVMANPQLMMALGDSAFGQAALAFYRKYADPEAVVKMGLKQLKKFWSERGEGKASADLAGRVFEACRTGAELYRELRRTGKLPFDYAQVQEELLSELDWMEKAEQQAKRLDGPIAEIYRRWDPDRTLEQIRGIGEVIAPVIEAMVGNIERFSNARRFVGYCGLCPRKKQSGMSDPAMPITKAGQRLLKKYLYLAADVARQWDPDFAVYYARRYARGDDHNRIVIALAHKMALRVYSLLKRREQARQAVATSRPAEPVNYVLRDPKDGSTIDKKQARALILEKYIRDVADPERSKRDSARRGKKTEVTGPEKVEWPSKDATNGTPAPPSQPQIARRRIERNQPEARGGDWESAGEVLSRIFGEALVENLRKSCGRSSGQSAPSLKKSS